MGLILDTSIIISCERAGAHFDFDSWSEHGDVFISAITVSELLVGVHRAKSDTIRTRRSAFVEAVVARLPALDFTGDIARVHAEVFASLSARGELIGAHDLLIAATALWHGCAVATNNESEFRRVPGLTVLT